MTSLCWAADPFPILDSPLPTVIPYIAQSLRREEVGRGGRMQEFPFQKPWSQKKRNL